MHHGQTILNRQIKAFFHVFFLILRNQERIRNQFVIDLRRLFSEYSVRHTVLIQNYSSAYSEIITLAYAGFRKSHGVGYCSMQAYSLYNDRMLGTGHVQIFFCRELIFAVIPLGLVKVGTLDPFSFRSFGCLGGQPLDSFFFALGSAQIYGGKSLAEREAMQVGVSHTWENCLTFQVDDFFCFVSFESFLGSSYEYKFSVFDDNSLFYNAFCFKRIRFGVNEDLVCC